MSRMTKYLAQTAQHERVKLDETGAAQLDAYGKPLYEEAVTVKCRKEPAKANSFSSLGQYVDHTTTYYTDESTKVSIQDKLDGHLVLQVYEYRDGAGSLVGYEVHV